MTSRRHTGQRYWDVSQEDPRLRVGLVGHWVGDGSGLTLRDRSGYGNHGTHVGGVSHALGRDGIRHALRFNGSTGKVVIPTFNVAAISVGAWIYMESLPGVGNQMRIAMKYAGSGGADGTVVFDISDDGDLRCLALNGGTLGSTATGVVVAKAWTYVAGVLSASAAAVFVNGVSRATGTTGTIPSNATDWTLGEDAAEGSVPEYLNGILDDVRIYNRALSDSEIALLADPGRRITPTGRRGRVLEEDGANSNLLLMGAG